MPLTKLSFLPDSSQERDLEAQICIVTRSPSLRADLHEEQERLFRHADPVDSGTFAAADRRVPAWVKFVVAMWRNFF